MLQETMDGDQVEAQISTIDTGNQIFLTNLALPRKNERAALALLKTHITGLDQEVCECRKTR